MKKKMQDKILIINQLENSQIRWCTNNLIFPENFIVKVL